VYYHNDRLGSPRVLTDKQGQVVENGTYVYSAYGTRVIGDPSLAANIQFTGHREDVELSTLARSGGLSYFGARPYDSSIARFIAPDPAQPDSHEPQGWNAYAYAFGNPLTYRDPTGYSPVRDDPDTTARDTGSRLSLGD